MNERVGEPRTLVIVPTYNESESISEVTERLFKGDSSLELLVVDDASPDGTAEVVRRLADGDARVHLLERSAKTGLGGAYVAGFRWALERGYEIVVEMDADLSHDPGQVPALVAALQDAELAIGSRYIPGGRVVNWGRFRRALSRGGNIYAGFWLRFGVTDSTSGFRAYRGSTLRSEDLTTVASQGYAFQIEMTRRVHRSGGRIVEVPITFVERSAGESKMSRRIVIEALREVTIWGLRDRFQRRR